MQILIPALGRMARTTRSGEYRTTTQQSASLSSLKIMSRALRRPVVLIVETDSIGK